MKNVLHVAVVIAALGLLLWTDSRAKAVRAVPDRPMTAAPALHVGSQKDIYYIYKRTGLWGARVVHLNRYLNLVAYLPKEESLSMPFPIRVRDVRPLYEKGLNAHNWLFIANRTGLVRTVTVVLPDPVFRERLAQFKGDYSYSASGNVVTGYSFDMPMMVTTLDALPVMNEPVMVDVDAGYFGFGEEPGQVIAKLREKCPDIRQIVVSESRDEPEVAAGDQDRLKIFEQGWGGGK